MDHHTVMWDQVEVRFDPTLFDAPAVVSAIRAAKTQLLGTADSVPNDFIVTISKDDDKQQLLTTVSSEDHPQLFQLASDIGAETLEELLTKDLDNVARFFEDYVNTHCS